MIKLMSRCIFRWIAGSKDQRQHISTYKGDGLLHVSFTNCEWEQKKNEEESSKWTLNRTVTLWENTKPSLDWPKSIASSKFLRELYG